MRRILPLLLLGACSGLTDSGGPVVRSADLLPSGPLARELRVELDRPAPLVVRYRAADGPALRVRSGRSGSHSLLLTRLRAGRSYRWEVEGSGEAGTFATDPLPEDLARVTLRVQGRPTTPLVLLHLHHPQGFRGYAVVDAAGEVVWYWRGTDFPYGAARRANGNFVFMDRTRGLVEVAPSGQVVRELPQDPAGREMHHDVISTPASTLLFLAFDPRPWKGGTLKGEAVWEWSPEAGTATKRWSSWDHLSPERDRGPRFDGEWMHANSLALGPRGNVLMSVHYFNQVVSIAPGWGRVEWRLGGVNATLPLPPGEEFSGQHTAREVSPGRVVLFDNRLEGSGYSRAVELELGGPVRRVWEWRATPANHSTLVSSARRLVSGNTLVAFGLSAGIVGATGPTEAYEVTPAGEAVWHLEVGNVQVMFRAEPLDAIGAEEEDPAG